MCGRKAKQSTHQAPEARHRTHSPAQRTPPAARRNGEALASITRAQAPRSGPATANNPHGGKADNVGGQSFAGQRRLRGPTRSSVATEVAPVVTVS